MNKVILIGFLSVLLFPSFSEMHKFYVSVTQIDYNQEAKTLQITSRIFIDDIEKVLRERYDPSIRLVSGEDEKEINVLLQKYLKQKLTIAVNGKEVEFNFLGKEYENDLMLCYLEVPHIDSLQTITISNKVLIDVYEEQQNIVHVKKGKERKSLIFQEDKQKYVLKFSE